MTGIPPARHRPATAEEAGRVCPYCRFALKQGAEVVECGGCRAAHHTDCWSDNGGCAVMGCSGAPSAGEATALVGGAPAQPRSPLPPPPPPRTSAQPPPPPPPNTYPPPAAANPAPPGAGGVRSTPAIAAIVVVVALAITGAAVAVLISANKKSPADPVAATVTVSPPPSPSPAPGSDADTDTDTGSTDVLAGIDESTMASDITRLLRSHHEAIVKGHYKTAWVLTSQRYRAKKLRELGSFEAWAKGQVDLGNHLDPSGVTASIREVDRRNGVATVDVTGMGWSKPGSPCSSWSGVTWARYENGHWRYEPGYSMSPQRRAEWFPRKEELLGWGC